LKSENRVESRLASRAPEADKNFAVIANLPGKESDWPDSDLRDEQEKKDILERVGENELDQNVVRCVMDQGLLSSGEIAAALNVPVGEVYKSKKRLRRKLQSLRTSSREESVDLPVDRSSSRNGDDQNAKL
jgi:DNA-directed RNA polymerase specialized sigma24 family protein